MKQGQTDSVKEGQRREAQENIMKNTTKTVYYKGNRCGSQYCNNCNGYGSKWNVTINSETGRQIGKARLIDANWTIDEKKIEETKDWEESIAY